ncbi:LuxR C-terminal-related transcriptional regulator [Arthrobacter polaris]|uniref:LuxR C-terminal-related transcriptional regulator n=1 Tax=Arthrobacter polaris TaxID=2813727 RepID=UPI003898EEAE|nr:hypothetical protein J0916_05560 [Arthrobacter polaris]
MTQREAEVLVIITQALSNIEITSRTQLSRNTVKTFIRSCYRRIGVAKSSNTILWGVERGFTPDRKRLGALQ